jgi:hypothetical protein
VGLEGGPLSLVITTEELLERKSSGSGLKTEIMAVGDPLRWLCDTVLYSKVATNFADRRRSLGRYISPAGSGNGVCFVCLIIIIIIINFAFFIAYSSRKCCPFVRCISAARFLSRLIVGFCIMLHVYPLMLFLKTTVRNNVFCARFYCALLTLLS